MDKMTRLVLADDNPHALHGLRAILTAQPGVEVAGEASQGDEAIALVETLQPDVALLDVRMPRTDGLQATRTIKKRWPKVRVILISMYADYKVEALSTGADAFLVKGCTAEELLTTILGVQPKKRKKINKKKGEDQMNIKTILQRSWQLVWQYRTLWILGMVLALTAANTIYFNPRQNVQNQPINNKIKFTDTFILKWPGDGLIIDLTAPEGARLIFTDGPAEREFRFLNDLVKPMRRSDFIAIAIAILVLAVLIKLIATIARYVTETAVIRMVNDTEATGKQLTLRQGLRMGWSVRAARLFLIDLLVGLVIVGVLALVLPMSIGSIMLVESFGFIAILLVALGVAGLLVFTGILLTGIGALASFIMQTVRRACVIDDMGVFASIGMGINMLRYHFKDVGITWLIWIGIRILWAPVSLVATIILAPVLFVFLLAGFAVGAVPAMLVTAITSPFVNGITSWIIGAMVGIPFLLLVTITPLLFIGGLVELYKSNMWTLAYRELSAMEHTVQVAQPKQPLTPAHGVTR